MLIYSMRYLPFSSCNLHFEIIVYWFNHFVIRLPISNSNHVAILQNTKNFNRKFLCKRNLYSRKAACSSVIQVRFRASHEKMKFCDDEQYIKYAYQILKGYFANEFN